MTACNCGEAGSATPGVGIWAAAGSETIEGGDGFGPEMRGAAASGRAADVPAIRWVDAAPAADPSGGCTTIENDTVGLDDRRAAAELCHASRIGMAARRCPIIHAGRSTDTPAASMRIAGGRPPGTDLGSARSRAVGAGLPVAGGRSLKPAMGAGAGSGASAS